MADFPCGVCKIDCEIDVIQCSNCEFWFHIQCISMTKSDLKICFVMRYFMLSFPDNNQAGVIEAFNSISRYLADLLNIDHPYFKQWNFPTFLKPVELN